MNCISCKDLTCFECLDDVKFLLNDEGLDVYEAAFQEGIDPSSDNIGA